MVRRMRKLVVDLEDADGPTPKKFLDQGGTFTWEDVEASLTLLSLALKSLKDDCARLNGHIESVHTSSSDAMLAHLSSGLPGWKKRLMESCAAAYVLCEDIVLIQRAIEHGKADSSR